MKFKQFIIFIIVVIIIYISINYYIFIRGLQAFSNIAYIENIYYFLFFVFSSSYIISFYTERRYSLSIINKILVWCGSLWLAVMFYFFLFAILTDLFRIINKLFNILVISSYTSFVITSIIVLFVFLLVIAGFINSLIPRLINLDIHISKRAGNIKRLNIIAVSDIHLGTLVNTKRIDKLVRKINSLNPDLILLAGDILSENLIPIIKNDIGNQLSQLKAPLGVYAVPGNHEYISGIEEACKYISSKNIMILRDSSVLIKDSIILVGREDKDMDRYSGAKRKTLETLLSGKNKSFPIIVIDHQPISINESLQNGIDLQISGHTHNGQIFPFNLITNKIFKISHGYKNINNSHFYVTSGLGTWGPPVRIASRPEIVNIKLNFD